LVAFEFFNNLTLLLLSFLLLFGSCKKATNPEPEPESDYTEFINNIIGS
jgi:hypothetical protein